MMFTQRRTPIALKLRVGFGLLFSTAVLFPSIFQPVLTLLWDVLKQNSFYRLSTFETLWTVLCYALVEVSLTVVFLRYPEWRFETGGTWKKTDDKADREKKGLPRPRGMRRPSRRLREIFTYVAPLLMMDLVMIKKFADVPLEKILESGNYFYDTNSLSLNTTSLLFRNHHKTFLIPTFHNVTASSPFQTQRALPAVAPTSQRLALELAASFFIYDALFFFFHFSLHVVPPLKRWHAPHHTHGEINPQITNQLSIPERLGLVMLANFSLNIIGAHVLTRSLFVPVFVWLLVEIHSGLDLPWAYEKVLPVGWGGGARKHAMHHAGGQEGFEPYFTWWDGLVKRIGINPGSGGETETVKR